MKKLAGILAVILVLTLLLPSALALPPASPSKAEILHRLGLFQGIGTDSSGNPNFDLDRAPPGMRA